MGEKKTPKFLTAAIAIALAAVLGLGIGWALGQFLSLIFR